MPNKLPKNLREQIKKARKRKTLSFSKLRISEINRKIMQTGSGVHLQKKRKRSYNRQRDKKEIEKDTLLK